MPITWKGKEVAVIRADSPSIIALYARCILLVTQPFTQSAPTVNLTSTWRFWMACPDGAGAPWPVPWMVQPSFISQVKKKTTPALILTMNMAPAEPVTPGTFRRVNLTSADNEKMAGVGECSQSLKITRCRALWTRFWHHHNRYEITVTSKGTAGRVCTASNNSNSVSR